MNALSTYELVAHCSGLVLTLITFFISIRCAVWKKDLQSGIWWMLLAIFCLLSNKMRSF